MRLRKLALATAILVAAGVAVPGDAISLPGVGKGALDKDSAEVDRAAGGAAEAVQAEILLKFDGALNGLIEAQVLLRRAFDIADESAAKESDAALLGLENCEDEDCLEAKIGMSERNQHEIDEALAEGRELDDQGKQLYGQALPLYARGTVDMGLLVPEVGEWSRKARAEIKDAGLRNARTVKRRLQVGTYIARRTPALAKTFTSATKAVVTYGNAKDLDTSAANDVEF